MENTIVYLIRHAETIDESGIRNTDETFQDINEKEILSIQGEQDSKKLSENKELKNLDTIWCSNYTRAKQTAKYIANENNTIYNIDKRLGERKLGNIEDLAKFMNDKKTRDPSREQLAFPDFKTRDGESANDTNKRMNEFINEILNKNQGKRIALISHGGAIKFYLLSHCKVNKELNLEYNGKELLISSTCLLKMTFNKHELVNIEQIINDENLEFNKNIPELAVTNLQRSLDFYKCIGFKVEYERKENKFVFLSLGKIQFMLQEVEDTNKWDVAPLTYPFGNGINFQLEVENLDPIYKSLKENNYKITFDIEENWYRQDNRYLGNREFLIQDPDGYLLRFSEDLGEKSI